MEKLLFNHLDTVRQVTEQMIERIPEELADEVPEGFKNNIRWNFGHIATIQEKLVIAALGESMQIPNKFLTYFDMGTKPADWAGEPPSFAEIKEVLQGQKARIKEVLSGRLEEKLAVPFEIKGGPSYDTAAEALLFSTYHEGLHVEAIKRIYRLVKNK